MASDDQESPPKESNQLLPPDPLREWAQLTAGNNAGLATGAMTMAIGNRYH